jgi:hypothetical protein
MTAALRFLATETESSNSDFDMLWKFIEVSPLSWKKVRRAAKKCAKPAR